ncbi:MAG: hypothetical protein EXS37_03875 [Opitutus sp.]|nr:hypothetical protein [Opitutus sp.]
MKSKLFTFLVVVGALAMAGAVLGRIAKPAWTAARERQPALRLDSSMAAAGQGVTLALLGGFRALVADAAWIRMYVLWEKRDLPAADTLIRLVAAIDPRPIYFWLNGARILAYDFPVWRIHAAGGFDTVAAQEQERIGLEQGQVALRHLDAAMVFHPANADLWIERANIQLNRLRDLSGAAESYRRAWAQPKAPYYAARMHAELLRRAGRKGEALAWLVQLHPTLPLGDEPAGTEVVLGRIRDLERELGVAPEQFYRPAR